MSEQGEQGELDADLKTRLEAVARGAGIRATGKLEFFFTARGLDDWNANARYSLADLERVELAGAAQEEEPPT